jgi:hypothetical protein
LRILQRQEKPNISKTAREFDVPMQRLRRRWLGTPSRSDRAPTNTKLSTEQEMALRRYIDTLIKLDIPPRPKQIGDAANSILYRGHTDPTTPPPQIGEHWTKRFHERYPEYRVRRQRAIEIERKRAHDPLIIQMWFHNLKGLMERNAIHPRDLYNFDETGFQIGIGKDQWIVTREFKKACFSPSSTNREYTTVVEAISADGHYIPPFIIFGGKCILAGWFDICDEPDYTIGMSDSGYINDLLAFQWIQHFDRHTKRRMLGVKRLLLCDGYGSHMTYEFIDFCEKNDIILYFLPPHTSHLLQPLDVGVFQAYKHWHSEAIEDATQTGCGKFTKVEFLSALFEIRRKTFKSRTLRHAFGLTGLNPWNPSVALERLQDSELFANEETSNSSFSATNTPKTARQINRYSRHILQLSPNEEDSFHTCLAKLVKATKTQAVLVEHLTERVRQSDAAKLARQRRAQASRAHLRTGGIIRKEDVNRMKRVKQDYNELVEKNRLRP